MAFDVRRGERAFLTPPRLPRCFELLGIASAARWLSSSSEPLSLVDEVKLFECSIRAIDRYRRLNALKVL